MRVDVIFGNWPISKLDVFRYISIPLSIERVSFSTLPNRDTVVIPLENAVNANKRSLSHYVNKCHTENDVILNGYGATKILDLTGVCFTSVLRN